MPDAAARADMRIEIVKREINQGALAGLGSEISDYAAQLVINALDTYDEEALKEEFRKGFHSGEYNMALLRDQEASDLRAAVERIRALAKLWRGSGAAQLMYVADEIEDALRGDPDEEGDRNA